MNKALQIAAMGVGGVAFFAASFVGFAKLTGVPLGEVAVVGPILGPLLDPPTPPRPEREFDGTAPADAVVRASIGALGAFSLPPPFERDELQQLTDEIKARRSDLARRLEAVDTRERELADHLARLEDMSAEMSRLRLDIERREAELELRALEVARDEDARGESDSVRDARLGKLLEGLDPRQAVTRLLEMRPEEAARVLVRMDDNRVTQILSLVPQERWRAYAEAYAALGD
jgi:flagellar motility protein MotE (MotC chaperone)